MIKLTPNAISAYRTTIPPPTFFQVQPPDAQPVSRIEIFHHTAGERFLVLSARDYPIEPVTVQEC